MQNPTPTPRRRPQHRIRRAIAILRTGTDPQAALALECARIEHRTDCVLARSAAAQQLIEVCDAATTARAFALAFN